MTYDQCIAMLKVFRPALVPGMIEDFEIQASEQRCLKLLREDNRFLPSLLAQGLALGEPPEKFDPALHRLISLSDHDYHIALIKLGMCFCYNLAESTLENPSIVENLNQTEESLVDFFRNETSIFGEFYEPFAGKILGSVMFDEDEFVADMASMGLSLVVGSLGEQQCPAQAAIKERPGLELHIINQVRDVPEQLCQDPTSGILNRILNH